MHNQTDLIYTAAELGNEEACLPDISGHAGHFGSRLSYPAPNPTAQDYHFFKFENHPMGLPIPWPFIMSEEYEGKWAVRSVENHAEVYLVGARETAAGLVIGLFDLNAEMESVPSIRINN